MFIAVGPPSFTALAFIGMAQDVEATGLFSGYTVLDGVTNPAIISDVLSILALVSALLLWALAFVRLSQPPHKRGNRKQDTNNISIVALCYRPGSRHMRHPSQLLSSQLVGLRVSQRRLHHRHHQDRRPPQLQSDRGRRHRHGSHSFLPLDSNCLLPCEGGGSPRYLLAGQG